MPTINTALDFTIDTLDLKCLLLHCRDAYQGYSLEKFSKETKENYSEYYSRNMNNIEKWGQPKTYSQWINCQIIALTT